MEYANFIIRNAAGVVFLLAALGKARDIPVFEDTLHALAVPARFRLVAAWALVATESGIGLAILSGRNAALASLLATCVLGLFAAVSIWAERSSQEIPCNCFGRSPTRLGMPTLARALLFELAILAFYATSLSGTSYPWWPTDISELVPSVGVAIGLVILGRWILEAPTLASLMRARNGLGG